MKFLRNCVLGLCVVVQLSGCTAVALLEKHTSSPFEAGLTYEEGYLNYNVPENSVKQSYERAYSSYRVADRLGDIRAKEKVNEIAGKLSTAERINAEKKVDGFSMRELRNYYHVPREYDRNLRK